VLRRRLNFQHACRAGRNPKSHRWARVRRRTCISTHPACCRAAWPCLCAAAGSCPHDRGRFRAMCRLTASQHPQLVLCLLYRFAASVRRARMPPCAVQACLQVRMHSVSRLCGRPSLSGAATRCLDWTMHMLRKWRSTCKRMAASYGRCRCRLQHGARSQHHGRYTWLFTALQKPTPAWGSTPGSCTAFLGRDRWSAGPSLACMPQSTRPYISRWPAHVGQTHKVTKGYHTQQQ
jgi:hypothetical protein